MATSQFSVIPVSTADHRYRSYDVCIKTDNRPRLREIPDLEEYAVRFLEGIEPEDGDVVYAQVLMQERPDTWLLQASFRSLFVERLLDRLHIDPRAAVGDSCTTGVYVYRKDSGSGKVWLESKDGPPAIENLPLVEINVLSVAIGKYALSGGECDL